MRTTWYEDADNDGEGGSFLFDIGVRLSPRATWPTTPMNVPLMEHCRPHPRGYQDTDGDGAGDPAVTQTACTQPAGYVAGSRGWVSYRPQ